MTLIELAVVVGIIAIVTTLAAASLSKMASWSAPMNASHDFYSALSLARTRATQTGRDVWFIVYPRGDGPTDGRGAWYVFDDLDGKFADPSSPFSYRNDFSPIALNPTSNATAGRLYLSGLLTQYSKRDVTFGFNGAFSFPAPFTALNPTSATTVACSFCSPSPFTAASRGAIVFGADGNARFYNATGGAVSARQVSLALVSGDAQRAYLYAVSAPTGFIAEYVR